ncbi:MAG: tRNA (N(6)-L-threonylcarbamoyladenosine(37)-C(2))-methylthiotransferase MtaB [Bacteroidales bacterium]|nr:tRNA (N(6)-L-threonylcarbamoyladenosine(37)-C(2))-methylthiotransferase MtaB [Bacteroidales bacterium]
MIDLETLSPERIALYHTLGCKLNFAETSSVAQTLAGRGFRRMAKGETPDVIVVNTCSVTELADKKSRQTIRSLHKRYPEAPIIVTGCYAQLQSEAVASLPGVAIVAGQDQKDLIADFIDSLSPRGVTALQRYSVTAPQLGDNDKAPLIEITPTKNIRRFIPSCSRGERTRFFLKVQDGCDYFCTYCTIPMARGRSRSGTIDQLVAQAADAAAQGGKEIVITGVNIGDFGKGRDDKFVDLIRALDQVDGIERYRISSIEPNLLTDEIIDFVAHSQRFMPHFHVPLQSGSDEVLRLMRRHYDTALFRHRMEQIRQAMPHAFIGVDLIVGARGETQEEFERSRDFIDSLPISRLHVFTYSERPGTRALSIGHVVPQEEKHRRTREMIRLSDRKLQAFTRQFIGTVRPALLEHAAPGEPLGGFTDNYLRVSVDVPSSLDNTIVPVRLDALAPEETILATISDSAPPAPPQRGGTIRMESPRFGGLGADN